jgi:hypothetical protein
LRSRLPTCKPEVDEANNEWVKNDQETTWPTITAYNYCTFVILLNVELKNAAG